MEKVYLISGDFIRANTNISDNIQDKFMKSAIRESQDCDLQQVLGTKLVSKLCDLVSNNDIMKEEFEDYRNLLNECQYYLCYSVITKLCLIASVKIDNIGLNMTNDINANQIYLSEVFKLESHYKNKADFYKERLQDYLKFNYKKYPELKDFDIYNKKAELNSAASSPIFLGGARGKRR